MTQFLPNSDGDFYERAKLKFPLKWQLVTEQNGVYKKTCKK